MHGVYLAHPHLKIGCVFEQDDIAVTSVSVSPATATVSVGQDLKLSATVNTTGFANKGVYWGINSEAEEEGAEINQEGILKIPSNYDNTASGTAGVYTIDIDTILETGDIVEVDNIKYTVDASSQDTIAKQITAMKSAFNVAGITRHYTIGGTSTTTTLTQKSGYYGQVEPNFVFKPLESSSGECAIEETTPGVVPANTIVVSATSVYDNSKSGTSKITVA